MDGFPQDAAFPGPQRFPLSSLPEDLHEAFDDPGAIEGQGTITTLRQYLRAAALPACLRFGQRPIGICPMFLTPWPENPEMKRPLGTRVLQKAVTLDKWDFSRNARRYIDELPELMIRVAHSGSLKIPADAIAELDKDEVERYSRIDGLDDLLEMLQTTLLSTIAECIRLIERMQRSASLYDSLKFARATSLCTAHHARWDILAMRDVAFDRMTLAIIVVPPWELSLNAFRRFAAPRDFPGNLLDSMPSNPADFISDKLWAVVHDACHERGRYFVVTNYTHWAFGRFAQGWNVAHITEPIEARMIELEGKGVNYAADNGVTVIESLLYWIQLARGAIPL
ncbi:hypothetical protein WG66_015723 [Moniliophthora roreri]|nr:hypothetical protein WG66_015723 [Moniliophthora roreri]